MKTQHIITHTLRATLLGSALLLSGCASIINGSNQKVKITSQPPGASVRIDGASTGATPTVAELSRKSSHRVEVSMNGYATYEKVLEPSFNGVTLLNILVGGIIGLAIDGSTGAGNTLQPEAVEAVLVKK